MSQDTTPQVPGIPLKRPDPRHLIHFATEQIPPPAALYITNDDTILVQAQNSVANQVLQVCRRYLAPDGQILPQFDTLALDTTRSPVNLALPQQEGFLLSITIACGVTTTRGQTFVSVFLIRGNNTTQLILPHLIIQGYTDSTCRLVWPGGVLSNSVDGGGNIRSITGAAPAAGAEVSETVPTNARWKLRAFRNVLTTSAAVANRGSTLIIDDGTNALWELETATVQAASLTIGYNYGAIGSRAPRVYGSNESNPLPVDLVLRAGYRIRTATALIQAADQYAAPQYEVEEWISS